jgi:hypothetical protein
MVLKQWEGPMTKLDRKRKKIAAANRAAAAKAVSAVQHVGNIGFWGSDPSTIGIEPPPPAPKPKIILRRGDDRIRPPGRAMMMSGGKPVMGRW